MRRIQNSSIKEVDSVGGEERGIDMSRTQWERMASTSYSSSLSMTSGSGFRKEGPCALVER